MNLRRIPDPIWWAVVGVAAVSAVYYFGKRVAAAAGAALNPTDPRNLAHSGVNAVGAAVTGDKSFSLGSAVFDAGQAVKSFLGLGPTDNERIREPVILPQIIPPDPQRTEYVTRNPAP